MKLRRLILVMVLVLPLTLISKPVFAELRRWYAIPGYSSAAASARMDTFRHGYSSGYGNGYIFIRNYNGDCVYVERKPVARGARVDGGWKRATPNRCSRGDVQYFWEDNFHLSYNGFKFRICRTRRGLPDSCGDSVTIYP